MKYWLPILLLFCFTPGTALGQCANNGGDITGDGTIDLLDAMCATQLLLADLLDETEPNLPCAAEGLPSLDQNCDGNRNLIDVSVVIHTALGASMPVEVDATGNGCPNACDADPIQVGASLPLWTLPDAQPESPLFGQTHGPKDAPGVRVIALLDGG